MARSLPCHASLQFTNLSGYDCTWVLQLQELILAASEGIVGWELNQGRSEIPVQTDCWIQPYILKLPIFSLKIQNVVKHTPDCMTECIITKKPCKRDEDDILQ